MLTEEQLEQHLAELTQEYGSTPTFKQRDQLDRIRRRITTTRYTRLRNEVRDIFLRLRELERKMERYSVITRMRPDINKLIALKAEYRKTVNELLDCL